MCLVTPSIVALGDAGRHEGSFRSLARSKIKVCVDDTKSNVQANKAEDATEAASKVYECLNKQMNMRRPYLLLHEDGKKGNSEVLHTWEWKIKDMKECCPKESLGLTCIEEYL